MMAEPTGQDGLGSGQGGDVPAAARPAAQSREQANRKMLVTCLLVIGGMIGVAYASVPLYRLFCQVTGYGGTPMIQAEGAAPVPVGDRIVTIEFDANTNRELPWQFEAVQRRVDIKVGEQGLAFYQATNTADRPIIGTATFNVTPLKAAQYFTKVDCFCFTEQRLDPGQTMDMPVSFYVDPAIGEDPHTLDITTITLSYTFFEDTEASGSLLPDQSAQISPAPAGQQDQINQTAAQTGGSIQGDRDS
ncbi:MAG: cytochrome c oxidase assembly protein [Rhodospirillaceae bacterium]